MFKFIFSVCLLSGLLADTAYGAAAPVAVIATDDPDWAITEVEVAKTQPGPAMWRVVKDDKVLWIMGDLGITPAVKWDSGRIERLLKGAERLYLPPRLIYSPADPMRNQLPGFRKLRDVIPAADYKRFRSLADRYGVKSSLIERAEPYQAAGILVTMIYSKFGYSDKIVTDQLSDMAKKHGVPADWIIVKDKTGKWDPGKNLTDAEQRQCLTNHLDIIEYKIAILNTELHAWSRGDVDTLKAIRADYPKNDCNDEFKQSDGISEAATLDAVEQAMVGSRRSVMVLPVYYWLIDEANLIDPLRRKGYTIRTPSGTVLPPLTDGTVPK